MEEARGSVRIGPISLFVLIMVLCLAVLAVLSLQTARAQQAITQQQALIIEDTYVNEVAGQEFVSELDAILAQGRNGSLNREDTLNRVTAFLNEKNTKDNMQVGYESEMSALVYADAVSEGADSIIDAIFMQKSGRKLVARIHINADLTYSIISWLVSTQWIEPDSDLVYWQG